MPGTRKVSRKSKAATTIGGNAARERQAVDKNLFQSRSQRPNPGRVFLLSPANASGIRAQLILREHAGFELALRLRREGTPLGDVFSFISGLYFRGKLAYSRAFAAAPSPVAGVFVITSSRGLVPPETIVTLEELREISAVPILATDLRYRTPLERDARKLAEQIGDSCEVVLLGSIASPKYVEPLLGVFGEKLLFPLEFVGRGDMSRGGLMLRCARAGTQLTYVPVATAVRHGPRPPKLPKLPASRLTKGPEIESWKP
jgi:hypothetical protein